MAKNLDDKQYIHTIFLDFSKAFDKVPFLRLKYKPKSMIKAVTFTNRYRIFFRQELIKLHYMLYLLPLLQSTPELHKAVCWAPPFPTIKK